MKTQPSNLLPKTLLLLFCIFSIQNAFSQLHKMEECPLDSDARGVVTRYSFWANRPSKADSQKYIFPKAKWVDFYLSSIVCQQVKKDSSNMGISAVFGADKNGDVLMIYDKNQNFNFRDDSVYRIPKTFYTNHQWITFKNIPVIDIDSLKFVDTAGKISTVKASFRSYPSPSMLGKSDYQFKGGALIIMPLKYYKTTIVEADSTYEFRVTKFPIASEFESLIPASEHIVRDEYCTLVKRKQGNDTMLWGVKLDLLWNRCHDSILPLNNRFYKIYSQDYFTKSVYINELANDSERMKPIVEKKIYPAIFTSYLVNKHQQSSCQFANSKLTLLYFTGSWCVPCELAFKDMVNFYKKYNGKVNVVAIDKEKNEAASLNYFNHKKIKWDLFYEPLNDESPKSIGKAFSVNTYPHYFLINEKSEVLKETYGYGGIQPIIDLLESNN